MKPNSKRESRSTPVAIVGIGAMFPGSPTLKAYWRLLLGGRDAVSEVPESHWSAADYFDPDPKSPDRVYCIRGGFLSPVPFDPTEFGLPPAILEATDTSQLLALITAKMALDDAGYGDGAVFDRSRTSVILGVTGTQELVIPLGARLGHPRWRRALQEAGVSAAKTDAVMEKIAASYVRWQENSFPGLLGNVVAGRICNRLDLGGTNCVVDAACASSMSALHLSLMELADGRSDMVLSGGVDTLNDIFMHMCFSKTGVLSRTGDARPFSADADGTVLGEGVGIVALKRLEDARKDGDRIYAVIRGIGSASDGRSQSIYAPRIEGQALALTRAYENAGIDPRTVELVEAHGTGTRVGDAVEFSALRQVLDPDGVGLPCTLGSVKSMIGHTKAAAGAAGLIKAALALYHKVMPPTLKADPVDPNLEIDRSRFFLAAAPRPWLQRGGHPRRAGVSAFGFGGSNYHAVVEEASPEKPAPAWDGACEIVAFSGADAAEVFQRALAFFDDWAGASFPERGLGHAAAKLRERFSAGDRWRLLAVVDPSNDAGRRLAQLRTAAADLAEDASRPVPPEADLYFGGPGPAGGLAVLFPGQGSQYPGMGLDLVCTFPEAFGPVSVFSGAGNDSPLLADLIYPRAPGGGAVEALRPTDVAQPAIGAVSLAMWRVLERFGVSPAAFAGHSFGELTALCAAGWMDEARFAALSVKRGRLMAAIGAERDPGAMIAVRAPLAEVEALAEAAGPDLVLANRNAPDQAVLAGAVGAVSDAESRCRNRGWRTVRLPVAAAFHSPLVAGAAEPFSEAVAQTPLVEGKTTVYSNTTAAPYPADPREACRILGRQLARPVDFVGQVEALYQAGCRIFVEVGPGRVLSGLVRSTLAGRDGQVFSMDDSAGKSGRGVGDLARTLCRLAAAGAAVDLSRWEAPEIEPRIPKMEILLSGANLRPQKQQTAGAERPVKPARNSEPAPSAPLRTASSGPQRSEASAAAGAAPPPPFTQQRSNLAMNDEKSAKDTPPAALGDAFRLVQEGLRSMQALQEQTARAHEKFLEIQAEAAKNLQRLMEGAGRLADAPRRPQAAADPPGPAPAAVAVPAPAPPLREPETVPDENAGTPAAVDAPHRTVGDDEPDPSVVETLVSVVSELTGYPAEMIGADMDIEADLGIDSIKRVEILSTVEERLPGLPQVTPEMMGTLRTLSQIAAFLSAGAGAAGDAPKAAAVQNETGEVEDATTHDDAPPLSRLTAAMVRRERPAGGPPPNLPDGRKIYVTRDAAGLCTALCAALSSSGLAVQDVSLSDPETDFSDAAGLVILADAAAGSDGETMLEDALMTASAAAASLEASAAEGFALFAGLVRLDGAFGFGGGGQFDPAAGGLSGLIKCAAIEWPQVLCKAIDIDPSWTDVNAIAREAAKEILSEDAGPEVGLSPGERTVVTVRPAPFSPPPEAPSFQEDDVILVTGGARGVTAAAAVALAESSRPTLILLGRSPAPKPEPSWIEGLSDPAEMKKAILENRFSGRRPSPAELEAAYRETAAGREIAETLSRIETAGGRARYFSIDIRDASLLASVLEEVRAFHGPVSAVVHGAGVLEDRLIVEKTRAQFDRVFSTKVRGLLSVLAATAKDPVRAILLFSSVAARFGNRGQADYAMANEVLNKIAQKEAASRTGCRVCAVNWGPWDGGMVSPALKREFERRGIDLIPMDAGARFMVREMTAPATDPVEVVVGAALETPRHTTAAEKLTLTLAREFDVEGCPVLASHVLDGKPVVPFALMADWLGHGALKENPGLCLIGLDDIRVLKGIRLDAEKRLVRLMAGKAARIKDLFLADVEIRDGVHDGTEVVHYRARAVLSDRPVQAPAFTPPVFADETPYHRSVEDAYREVLFHGSHLQGIRRILAFSASGMRAELAPAPGPESWMAQPPYEQWVLDPLVLDSAFQMSTLWCYERFGKPSLPSYGASYRQYQGFPDTSVTAVLKIRETGGSRIKGDFSFLDSRGALVARLTGYEAVMDPSLIRAFKPEKATV